MSDNKFKPYIPAEKSLPEFTATSVFCWLFCSAAQTHTWDFELV